AARVVVGEAERGRPDRLVAGRDRQLVRAGVWGGEKTGPSPVDRSRSGSKHHLIACGRGTPLAVSLTGGNRNDITQLIPLVDAIPPVRGRRGRPRRRPGKLSATAPTTRGRGAASCERAASARRSPGPRASTAPGSARSGGSSSA